MATPNVVFTLSDFTVEVSGSGYKVQLSPKYEGTTDSDGVVTFSSVTPGIYTLNVPGTGIPGLRVTVPNATGPYNAIDIVNDGQGWAVPGGSPEGRVVGKPQDRYYDPVNNADYVKASGTGTTGWQKLVTLASVLALVAFSLFAADPQIGDTSVQPSLTQNSNVTLSNITAKGYLSLSGATNRLTVADGSLKLDGTPVAAQSDPFVITSSLVDNATNVALVVGADSTWTGGWLIKGQNDTHKFGVDYSGAIVASAITLGGPGICTALNFAPAAADLFDGPCDGSVALFNVDGSGNLELKSGGNKNVLYIDNATPEVDIGDFTKAVPTYLYGSKIQVDANATSTDPAFRVRQGSSSVLDVTQTGALITQSGTGITPANASATGAAGTVIWDANYIYICVAANTWKRAAISTW